LAWVRVSSAVLVHTKGWERSFQPSMARLLELRSRTSLIRFGDHPDRALTQLTGVNAETCHDFILQ